MITEFKTLTLTSGNTVNVIERISNDTFKVSYGKDTKGGDIVGLVNREHIMLFNCN